MNDDDLLTATPRTTGRPVTIDPDAVARIALRLFAEHGYEHVSMEDIAREAGIGRKSLYRYFSTKADLIWGGIEPVAAAAGRALDEISKSPLSGDGILAGLRDAIIAAASVLPDLSVTRGRLRLIAEHPELAGRGRGSMDPQRNRAHKYLLEVGVPAVTARYLTAAYGAVTFEAWQQWALGEDPDPVPHLLAAMEVLKLPAGGL